MIDMNKKYQTTEGVPVRILCVDAKCDTPVVVLIQYPEQDYIIRLDSVGNPPGTDKPYITEVPKYTDFKKGDPVMVREHGMGSWLRRYFSHEKDGAAFTFIDGCTGWTTTETISWDLCRKPTQEELGTPLS